MKLFLITFLSVFLTINSVCAYASDPASASTPEDEWSSIRKDRDLAIAWPDITEATGGVFNTCITENEIRSIKPVTLCTEYKIIETAPSSSEFGEAEFQCLKKRTSNVAFNRDLQESECEESVRFQNENENGVCQKFKTSSTFPENLKLDVIRNSGEAKGHTLFIKEYQLPRC